MIGVIPLSAAATSGTQGMRGATLGIHLALLGRSGRLA